MTTITRPQPIRTDSTGDTERRLFSIIVLAGTIALAGAGMALAILLGAHAFSVSTLLGAPAPW